MTWIQEKLCVWEKTNKGGRRNVGEGGGVGEVKGAKSRGLDEKGGIID